MAGTYIDDWFNEHYDAREDFEEYDYAEVNTGFCSCCREPCGIVTVDNGVGTTEYWGSVSTHHQYDQVSDCCHADVLDSLGEDE